MLPTVCRHPLMPWRKPGDPAVYFRGHDGGLEELSQRLSARQAGRGPGEHQTRAVQNTYDGSAYRWSRPLRHHVGPRDSPRRRCAMAHGPTRMLVLAPQVWDWYCRARSFDEFMRFYKPRHDTPAEVCVRPLLVSPFPHNRVQNCVEIF